jgi:DNA polymerase-3 subunit gamma/tau
MSYVIFARKFRPQNFEEVVGQEAVTKTLTNAIRQKRISQSFLFAGPRGVGKTSIARIFAKSLNCEQGPTEKPCGKCISCEEITKGNALDVLEIDGASNRGIDEIRNLRETVKFNPASGNFKIYIIDEVHMLTTEAFNALLKTLEEPPAHVKFIFATTESHKVPLTILSRCQRYNFKRISTADITSKLADIAKHEKLKFSNKALFLIAKTADGALRDAESLLDQLASFSEEEIKEEDVLFMLGLASEEVYFQVLEATRNKDASEVFNIVRNLYDGGRDLVQFAKGLLEIFRHLLLLQCSENANQFIEMSDEGIEGLKERKNLFSRGELLLALSIVGNLQIQLRRNIASPRLLIETTLLKIMHIDGMMSTEEAVEKAPTQSMNPTAGQAVPAAKHANQTSSAKTSTSSNVSAQNKAPMNLQPKGQEVITSSLSQSAAVAMEGAAQDTSITINEVEKIWPEILKYVKNKRMSIGIFLSEAQPVETRDKMLVLGLPSEFQFHKETLDKNDNKALVQEAFEVVAKKKIGLQFVITKIAVAEVENDAAENPPAPTEAEKGDLPDIIVDALDIFDGGRVVSND